MKLGLTVGYWGAGPPANVEQSIAIAEECGYDSLWTAEAYGSDALTPLAWWGAQTTKIKLGTAIMQLSARTPAATAMAAMTLDHLSNGRFQLGIGASGPQVVEGWYGQPYPRPLERTREYIDVIRAIIKRDAPVEYHGKQIELPHPGGAGLGKPLKSTIHPYRTDIPIFLAAEGPKNVALAGEIADGWLPLFFSPKSDKFYRDALSEGFSRKGALHNAPDFEVAANVPVIITDDVEAGAGMIKPMLALYVGGMGAKGANFHYDVLARLGYEDECAKVQELYLEGKKGEAIAAIPTKMAEDTALIGPIGKIKDELAMWKKTALTTMLIAGPPPVLRTMADLVL